jgi:hypothetical protein
VAVAVAGWQSEKSIQPKIKLYNYSQHIFFKHNIHIIYNPFIIHFQSIWSIFNPFQSIFKTILTHFDPFLVNFLQVTAVTQLDLDHCALLGDTGLCRGCGLANGSGWVAVTPLDRGDQCGSNGVD